MMNHFPQLVQTSPTTFSGYAVVKGRPIPLFISTPPGWQPGRPMHDTQIATTDDCSSVIQGIMPPFAKKLAAIRDLDQLFLELSNLLNQHIAAEPVRTASLNTLHTSTAELVDDLELCADSIKSIRSDLSFIEFHLPIPLPNGQSDAFVTVTVQCVIQPGYPSTAPAFQSFDVPSDAIPPPTTAPNDPTVLPVAWQTSSSNRFASALSHISQSLSRFAPFWAELAHLARNVRLHSTEFATARPLAATWRSIDLGEYVYLELPLSVTNPRGTAPLRDYARFIGNETLAGPLRNKWLANVSSKWQCNVSVVDNIRAVLEHDLPLPVVGQGGLGEDEKDDEEEEACAICYEDIGDAFLVVKCACQQQYHRKCLESVYVRQMAMLVLGRRMGKCPLCNAPLAIPPA